jgi:hypothetical protein
MEVTDDSPLAPVTVNRFSKIESNSSISIACSNACSLFPVRRGIVFVFAYSRAESAWLKMQELQARLDAATGNRDRLRRQLDRRLEIIEELK